ncbi:hypothetical protein NC652_031241 [Populus alba x Populus x berolinensis]|nr:hypothetical protein NC652_031241 [Populus alba x Populus x berolinensis]
MSMEAGVGLMGTKLGMMSYFEPNGKVVPVTVVGFREGNIVTQIKTDATDGSFRLQGLDGFEVGQKLLFEELFKEGDLVDVSGTTIGKGFQGSAQDWCWLLLLFCIRLKYPGCYLLLYHVCMVVLSVTISKGVRLAMVPRSHRALGSIGAGTTPGRVYKGKKMPGRMGGTKTKIRKLKIVKIDNDLRVVMIKGALPGKPGNLLRIAPAKIVGKNIPKS